MPLKITTADERLARDPKVNIALFGPAGVGKTFQARTLDQDTTLFVDLEAGMLALDGDAGVEPWRGDSINVRHAAQEIGVHPWEFCRALACLLCGPDPSVRSEGDSGFSVADSIHPYGPTMYNMYLDAFGADFSKYNTLFFDSITVAARFCLDWSKRQPEAMSEKTGKPDNRGAYGLHGQEMVRWLTTLQHIPGKSIIVVGILDVEEDELHRMIYSPQIDGSKAARELPGIFDVVLTLGFFNLDDGGNATLDMKHGQHRGFVCQKSNPWGVPAKSRGGTLEMIEAPNLATLMDKITGGKRLDKPDFTAGAAPAPNPLPATPSPTTEAPAEGATA